MELSRGLDRKRVYLTVTKNTFIPPFASLTKIFGKFGNFKFIKHEVKPDFAGEEIYVEYLDVSSATAAWSQKDQILHEIDLLVANAQFTHGEEEEDKKEDQTEKTYARVLYRDADSVFIQLPEGTFKLGEEDITTSNPQQKTSTFEKEITQCWNIILSHLGIPFRERKSISKELMANLSLPDLFEKLNLGNLPSNDYLGQYSDKLKLCAETNKISGSVHVEKTPTTEKKSEAEKDDFSWAGRF